MSYLNDPNWWAFSIDSDLRGGASAKLTGDLEINPVLPEDELQLLDYHAYIGLNKLLDCQVPSSMVPDERIFIVTHQMFELAFKMMIFDCAVIARTFQVLLTKDDDVLATLCLSSSSSDSAENFWRPALTASGRLKFFSGKVLHVLMTLLAPVESSGEDAIELFDPSEFKTFRQNLIPASGFQTAQFRLIQRSLGKSNLLGVRLFPSHKFQKCYLGQESVNGVPVSLVDQLVLRGGYILANPPATSTPASAARLDDLAHELLSRLPPCDGSLKDPSVILLRDDEASIEDLVTKYVAMLTQLQEMEGDANWKIQDAAETFRETWNKAVRQENNRRKSQNSARQAADRLTKFPDNASFIAKILNRILDTDRNLHGYQDHQGRVVGGFLNAHRHTAGRQIADDPKARDGGTSGGGMPYLQFSTDQLFQLFPALVAYADLHVSSCDNEQQELATTSA
jgi:tryptophan 2,3-dioxygenase